MSVKVKQDNSIPKKFLLPLIILLFCFACSSNKAFLKGTSPFEAEALFKQANDKMRRGDYEAAREILERIKAQDASQKYAPLAKIRIGDTYFQDEQYEEAAVEYKSFLEQHPYHKYASYAQYQLAMTFYKRIKTVDISYSMAKEALNEFEKLLRRYPRNPYIDVTERRIKTCKGVLAEYEFYVGKFYFKKGSYRAAAQRFNDLIQNYPDSKKEAEALYHLGLSYKNLGDRDKAISVLTTLIEKFPVTKLSNEAKELIATFRKEE